MSGGCPSGDGDGGPHVMAPTGTQRGSRAGGRSRRRATSASPEPGLAMEMTSPSPSRTANTRRCRSVTPPDVHVNASRRAGTPSSTMLPGHVRLDRAAAPLGHLAPHVRGERLEPEVRAGAERPDEPVRRPRLALQPDPVGARVLDDARRHAVPGRRVAADGIMLTASPGNGHVYPYARDSIVQVVAGVRDGRGVPEGPARRGR